MQKKGLLVVFEGLDGSGKGTQLNMFEKVLVADNDFISPKQMKLFNEEVRKVYKRKDEQFDLLTHYLQVKNIPFSTYDFPRYYENYWGKMVGRMMNKDFGVRINPYLRSMFYMLDQADACKKSIRKELRQGKVVICNRYLTSSMIFQNALIPTKKGKKEFTDWLEHTAYNELKMIRPDVVIALYVDPVKAQELILLKNKRDYTKGKAKDLNEENIKLQIKAGKEMKRFCLERKEWKLIDCMDGPNIKSPETISGSIKEILKNYLN